MFLSDYNIAEFKRRYEKYLNDIDTNVKGNGFIRAVGDSIGQTVGMPTDLLRKSVALDRINITTKSYNPHISRKKLRESLGGASQQGAQDVLANKGTVVERIARQKQRLAKRNDIMRPGANPNNYSNVNVPKKPTPKVKLTESTFTPKGGVKTVFLPAKESKTGMKNLTKMSTNNKYLLGGALGLGGAGLAIGAMSLRDRVRNKNKR